jgi:predicted DNA-binding protein with PD1-like motif
VQTELAQKHGLARSHFTAIGAFRDVVLGFFNREQKRYQEIPVNAQLEVLSLMGNIALDEADQPKVHAQAVLGWSDGTAVGGHAR